MRNLLILAPLLLLTLQWCNGGGTGLNDDVLGLIVFKADIVNSAAKLWSWSEDDNSACGWTGIRCDSSSGRVVELTLDGYGLSGKLGRGLLQLQSLRKLSLSHNNFSGTFSADFSSLNSLFFIDLSFNSLSGPLPDEFFRQCRSIRSLSLAYNAFTGEIPSSIGSCSSLASLNLSSNRLTGTLPSAIWSLNALRSLDLSNNFLAGDVPAGINRMYNLRTITLSGNRLSGHLTDDIGDCLLLRSIDFSKNLLTGDLPETMRRLTMCNSLNLSSNSLAGDLPEWIGDLKNLQSVDLSNNGFSGRVPSSVGNLWLLRELKLSGNYLAGNLPDSIARCKNLKDLDVSRNLLEGNLPSWIFELGLQKISLSVNRFSVSFPAEIGKIASLKYLNISSNFLFGSLPSSIGALKSVETIDLSSNQLNGTIPPEISGALSLQELRLGKNSLTGEIPAQIGKCSSLTSLILSHNKLTGPIPATFANLTNLQIIDLSFNGLSGAIPKQLGDLANLHSFNISHNHLSGDLPAGKFFNTISPSSLSGNPDLCGAVVKRTCRNTLAKPIVLNPNSSSPSNPARNTGFSPENLRHKKIILSISALIAIGAAALIALGVVTITILNVRVRAASAANSAAVLTLSDDYLSHSPATDSNSGKLVMFTGDDPDFSTGSQALLNKDSELGRGGFGAVYKTVLPNGRPVAIKKLTVSSLVKSQEDFEREVKKLGKMQHPNLVTLEGYYWTHSLQLLIYEFVSGGSLYKHLHEMATLSPLSWQERFDIIMGVAKSLSHLHRHNIIHYNLKSSNVLIDGSGEPKVGDYGLAKLLPMLDRYILSSKFQSALGYMAPEFACRTVKITEKCDVYGFGVLVLEIVTGRRPVEYTEDDVVVLCDVVRGALEDGRADKCVDGKLHGSFPAEEAVPVIKLGLICTSQVPSNRPAMGEVVNILELIRCPQEIQGDESN